ncbi:DUF2397 family protein [Nocardiopsis composta]
MTQQLKTRADRDRTGAAGRPCCASPGGSTRPTRRPRTTSTPPPSRPTRRASSAAPGTRPPRRGELVELAPAHVAAAPADGPLPTAAVPDHSDQRARLRDAAEARAHWRRSAAAEVRTALAGGAERLELSTPALDVLMELLTAALGSGSPEARQVTAGDLELGVRLHVGSAPGPGSRSPPRRRSRPRRRLAAGDRPRRAGAAARTGGRRSRRGSR